MANMEFMLKNQMLSALHTGNMIFDMMLGMFLCSIIATLTSFLNFKKIKKIVYKLLSKFKNDENKKVITFSCKKDYGYPDSFKAILYFINKEPNKYLSHLKFITSTKYNYKSDDEHDDSFFVIDEEKEIKIADHFYVMFTTSEENNKCKDGSSKIITTFDLDIYSYTKSLEELKIFIQKISEKYSKYIIEKSIKNQYFVECSYDTKKDRIKFNKHIFTTNRSYDNIFFDQKQQVLNKINFFLNNRDWYDKRGIPYTLGLLLYGDPGCGKTSLIKAIMKETGRHALSINLSNDFNLDKLKELMLDDNVDDLIIPQDRRIFVMEDIDAMGDMVKDRDLKELEQANLSSVVGKKVENKELESILLTSLKDTNSKNNLSSLLNIIDGIIECPGRIIIMTTNKEQTLDKALIRPGRVDMKINFTKCSTEMMKKLIELFYDIKLDKSMYSKLKKVTEYSLTPAEIMELCFSNNELETLFKILIDVE